MVGAPSQSNDDGEEAVFEVEVVDQQKKTASYISS